MGRPREVLRIEVRDAKGAQGLPMALVILKFGDTHQAQVTDEEGVAIFRNLAPGAYTLKVKYVGYSTIERLVQVGTERLVEVALHEESRAIREVVITAKEGQGATSASLIGQDAIQHLQPSTFGDLMELLPGGFSRDPDLTTPETIKIREALIPAANVPRLWARIGMENYTTSRLGTQVMVDGIPMNTHADLQSFKGLWRPDFAKHIFKNRGVDARQLSVDNIDYVEIVRGIPSVEYSNLTSGLVKIQRKRFSGLEGRMKADMASLQCYAAQGMDFQDSTLNLLFSADYINAFNDPRNVRERFQRATGSLRLYKRWERPRATVLLNAATDYTGSFDNNKPDPDINLGNRDDFYVSHQRLQGALGLQCRFKENPLRLRELDCQLSLDGSWDLMEITRYVQAGLSTPLIVWSEPGEHYAQISPFDYEAWQTVKGNPVYGYSSLKLSHLLMDPLGGQYEFRYGGNVRYAKNFGRGTEFDLERPVYPSSATRPRAFSAVPGETVLTFWAENASSWHFWHIDLDLMAGLSASTMAFLPQEYALSHRWSLDPRINVSLSWAVAHLGGHMLELKAVGGVGWLSMMPTIDQLFPEPIYIDLGQLNYWHEKREFRIAHYRTYVEQSHTQQLLAAKNFKWEARLDAQWGGYALSITYFEEDMLNGFRYGSIYKPLFYKQYQTDKLDHQHLTAPPSVDELDYEVRYAAYLLPNPSNGSETYKKGIEWSFSTMRFPRSHLRITANGAWLVNRYRNSLPQYVRPPVSIMGKDYPYMGKYNDVEGVEQETLNTTIRLDAYVPTLALGISLALQTNWFGKSRHLPRYEWPDAYIDFSSVERPFRPEDQNDPQLRLLYRPVDTYESKLYTVPMLSSVNLKATKELFKGRLRIALFVNKIFDYAPDYTVEGVTIRRYQDPYFGMEINLKL